MNRKARGLGGFFEAANEAYGEGREEWSKAYREGRKAQGVSENAPRIDEMTGAYPTGIRIKEAFDDLTGRKLSKKESDNRLIREDLGIGPKSDPIERAGQLVGTAGADLTQDNTRNFWWLLNAAQATGNVIQEKSMGMANPGLFGKSPVMNPGTNKPYKVKEAIGSDYLDSRGQPRKGVSINDQGEVEKRNFEPGHLAALSIPTGIAINTGLGLLTPFGGAEGYKAAVPDDEDPTKTANVINEIGQKYFLGKTGKLLPYSQFSEARPDVSPEEYKAYSAFKYDNRTDLNPFDDGQFVAPGGVIKTTDDGIHGAELQFLGRSLPVNTGLVPYAFALGGGLAGVRTKTGGRFGQFGGAIRGGFGGGMAGLAVGQVAGQLLESERRRRNTVENQLDNPQS